MTRNAMVGVARSCKVIIAKMRKPSFLLIALLLLQWKAIPVQIQLESPANATCACPGEVLTYTCIVEGGNSTVTIWGGSAFDCAGNEIVLDHNEFDNGTSGECNSGAIVGYSVDAFGKYYTSQLDVIVSNVLNNKTVNCSSDSELVKDISSAGESWINVAVFSAPDTVYLSDINEDKLVFSWTPVASDTNCSSLQYNITSDCGTCPLVMSSIDTTATCSDLQLTTNANECHFNVSSVVRTCDLAGDPISVAVTLKVPNIPQVKLIPSYSNESQALEMLYIVTTMIEPDDLFNISGNISGSPTSYIAHISNLVSGMSFNSTVDLYQSSCEVHSGCLVALPDPSYCSQSTTIDVAISATNKLGKGPSSNPFLIACINNFVQAVYNGKTSTISCNFLNPSDTSKKTCCVIYQEHDQKMDENFQNPKCIQTKAYKIELEVSGNSNQTYYYTITASNGTYTVEVEGNFTTGFNNQKNASVPLYIAIPPPVAFALLLIIIGVIIAAVFVHRKCSKNQRLRQQGYHRLIEGEDATTLPVLPQNILKQYLVPYQLAPTLRPHKVLRDSKLHEYVTEILNADCGFKRGHAYYEFTNEVENILEGKEVLLQDRMKTTEWFKLDIAKALADGRLTLYGEGIVCSTFGDQYRVFIQSFGSGTRHLPGGSWILYNDSNDQVEPDALPLVPVCSEHFAHKVINSEEECTVEEFCMRNKLNPKALNIFLTVEHLPDRMRDQPPRDAILMDKMPKKLFTGPKARQMLVNDSKRGGERKHGNERWKIFGLLEMKKKDLVLKKGSEVLYQDPRYMKGKYTVIEVDEDDVRMSKFTETKLHCKFQDGRAFYEATEDEEDFLYYKKILRPDKNELISREQLELQPLVEYFYAIDGVPAKAVKLKDLQHRAVFIQSTSQGSRCLKKGKKILYLKEYISTPDPKEAHHTLPDPVTSEDEHHHIHGQKSVV